MSRYIRSFKAAFAAQISIIADWTRRLAPTAAVQQIRRWAENWNRQREVRRAFLRSIR
ncbi:MAG: hypothetical protein WB820_03565 [Rhodoplanes sp.]